MNAHALDRYRFPKQKPGFESLLGPDTLDVYLNEKAYWKNVPRAVWEYTLGGYQVLKKWLSYREKAILGRGLRIEEVAHVRDTARRISCSARNWMRTTRPPLRMATHGRGHEI